MSIGFETQDDKMKAIQFLMNDCQADLDKIDFH